MKTKSPVSSFTNLLLLGIACVTAITLVTGNASAQSSQFNETPDPYFKERTDSKTSQYSGALDAHRDSAQFHWTTPRTITQANTEQSPPRLSVEWDPPSINGNKKRPIGSDQLGSLQPVNSPPTVSIIRERQAPQTDSFSAKSDNSFDSPIAPLNPKGTDVSPASYQSDFQPNSIPVQQSNFEAPLTQTRSEPVVTTASFQLSAQNNELPKTQPPNSTEPTVSDESKDEAFQSFEPGKVLALVGGEPIFVGDLNFEVNQMIEKFMPGAPPEIKERERQKMIPQILPKFVESKILFLGALRSLPDGVDIEQILEQASTEFDEKALKQMITGSGLKSSTEFDAQLRSFGSSLRKLRRSWSVDQLTKYFVGQKLNIDSEVSHQEMLESYHENIVSYALPAKTRWEQVMIRYDRSPSKTAAKETLVELGNEIVYGANMQALAKKHSHGFLASEGGQHDWTSKGALVLKEIDEAIFTLPVGKLSDIIETGDGVHIVRVLERTEETRKPFLDAQVEIKARILETKRKKAFDEHLAKLKREIPVEYLLNEARMSSLQTVTPRTTNR